MISKHPAFGSPDRRTTRRGASLLTLLDRNRGAAVGAAVTYLVAVSVLPITMMPYRSDDIINHTIPSSLKGPGFEYAASFVAGIRAMVSQWMRNEGRFFPGSVTWTFTVFTVFQTRASYKMFIAFLCALMTILVCALVVSITHEILVGALVAVSLSTTITLRLWFDGLDSFSGILPLTISLAVGSMILLIRGQRRLSIILAIALWAYALVTYEVVIAITPIACLLVALARRGPARWLALLWPTAATGMLVLHLRSRATQVAPAYTMNFEPVRVAATYAKQAGAALPLSQVWYPGAVAPHLDGAVMALSLLLIGIPAAGVLTCVARARLDVSVRSIISIAIAGVTFWLGPALVVAVTLGWQNELPRGQGYVSVVWGYVGVALVFTAVWLMVVRAARRRPGVMSSAAITLSTLALAVLAALNVGQSLSIASTIIFPPA